MKVVDMEVEYIQHCGSDLSVVNAARVSMHKRVDEFTDKDEKLLSYLAKHKHHSPFNHAFLTVRVKAPIFVARQLVKHKFMPWNEVSRRYVDDEPEFYNPPLRKRADKVKQGSSEELLADSRSSLVVQMSSIDGLIRYRELLDRGACPEQARMVLPQNTMTEWYWSGTLGAFLDMLKLRLDPHTQRETQEVAKRIAVFVEQHFPVSYKTYLGDSQ